MEKDVRSNVLVTTFGFLISIYGSTYVRFSGDSNKKKFNLISCAEISKPYLNDKHFLISILNSQIDKYWKKGKTKIFEVDIRVPTDLLIDDRDFISLSFKGHSLSQKKIVVLAQPWTGRKIWSLVSSNNVQLNKTDEHMTSLLHKFWIKQVVENRLLAHRIQRAEGQRTRNSWALLVVYHID